MKRNPQQPIRATSDLKNWRLDPDDRIYMELEKETYRGKYFRKKRKAEKIEPIEMPF